MGITAKNKPFKIAAIVILLLLLACWGLLRYWEYCSYQNSVHKDADIIIKVNNKKLIRKLAFNAVLNPSYFYKRTEDEPAIEEEKEDEKTTGFKIPANLFIYSLKGAPETFYTSIEISDSAAVKRFLSKHLKIDDFQHQKDHWYGASSDREIQAAYNSRVLSLAYTFTKEEVKEDLARILQKRDMLGAGDVRIATLKEFNEDLVMMRGGNVTKLEFDNGTINLQGTLQLTNYFDIPVQPQLTPDDTTTSLHLQLAGKVAPEYRKSYAFNGIDIPLDSISYYFDSYLAIRVAGTAFQTDTITTYDYNDDFEKVAIQTIQENEVPGVYARLKGNAVELVRLLEKEKITYQNRVNRALFPLLDLQVREESQAFLNISNNSPAAIQELNDSKDFFRLYANFSRLRQQQQVLPLPKPLLQKLDRLTIAASKNQEQIDFNGQLSLNDKNINALVQLIGE